MKIDLQNKTHWRNDHIRAFVTKAARDERPDLFKRRAPSLTVAVSYTRGGNGSSGHAYLRSNWIEVRLPKHGSPDKVDFAFVIAHELAHTRGVNHRAMGRNSHYNRTRTYRTIYAWGEFLPLEIKAKKVSVRPTAKVKLVHARKMFKTAVTREKRAVTLRKKWQQKIKYYEKQTALRRAA